MPLHDRALRLFAVTFIAASALHAQDVIQLEDAKAAVGPPTASMSQPAVRQVPNRYIIRFVPGTPAIDRANEAASIGARVLHNFAFSSAIVVELPNANAIQGLNRSRNVVEVTPDVYAEIAAKPGTAPPRAPNNFEASVSGSDVSLIWNDRANDEDGYIVRRCEGGGCTPVDYSGTLPANTASFFDPGLAAGTYFYEVIAFNGQGSSSSGIVSAVVDGEPPPPPPPPPPGPGDGAVRGTRQVLSYAVQRVGRPVAGSTGLGIGVALIDTGLDFTHPDLAPAPDVPGTVDGGAQTATGTSFNAVAPSSSCQDIFGHGTHVAGLLGAVDNNMGIVGVAPGSTIYCAKVGDSELIPLTNVQAALEWVLLRHDQVNPPIRVVNMSLVSPASGSATQTEIANLIQQLYMAGVATVAAAGNDPSVETASMFPASVANVISVAGTTATDGLNTCGSLGWVLADSPYAYTTDGPGVTISAPAEERADFIPGGLGCTALFYGVLSTSLIVNDGPPTPAPITRKLPLPGGPVEARGTSFAAPLVSGAIARILEQSLLDGPLSGSSADVDDARATLVNTADRTGEAPLDHPWAGALVTYSPDGVMEGIAQAPMPAP